MMIGSLLSHRDNLPASNRLWAYREVVMGFSYLLSPTAPAPRTRCLGSTVARFARPFESRPVDPVRRECYRQLAENYTAVTTGWLAPSGYLATTPPPLDQGQEERSQSYLPPLKKGRRKKKVLE